MNPYKVRQVDNDGQLLSETHVSAADCNSALRQVARVVDGAERIEVYNDEGLKAGEMHADYWRIKGRQR